MRSSSNSIRRTEIKDHPSKRKENDTKERQLGLLIVDGDSNDN
jgi:hypothetical protein